MSKLEEGIEFRFDFDKLASVAKCSPGVAPVVVQHVDTGEVILLAYTNEAALRQALAEQRLVLWSTSRNKLWVKGQTSGEVFDLLEIRVNCEQNSLLYRVRPRRGGICHTQNVTGQPRNCFYRRLHPQTLTLENIDP